MRPESEEFFRLLEAADWSPAEAARRLELNPGTISQYKGTVAPSKQTMNLLKMILANEKPEAMQSAGLREEGPTFTEAETRRANEAERKLMEVESGLRKILEGMGPNYRNAAKSPRVAEAARRLAQVAAERERAKRS